MRFHRFDGVALLLSLVTSLAFQTARPVHAATAEQIREAIDRGKQALYALQEKGNWERQADDVHGNQITGKTALALYALLSAGESHHDPRLVPAIEYLKKTDTTGVYALGMRCNVWLLLPPTPEVRRAATQDSRVLLNSIIRRNGDGKGFYDYNPSGRMAYSHSRAQYGVLGMWAAAQMGIEVPTAYWQMVEDAWIADQDPAGGWSYRSRPTDSFPITPGMTAVGVATLFITQDYLHASDDLGCRGNVRNPNIDKGVEWLAANFDKVATDDRYSRDFPYSTLYAIERIGVAGGYKHLKNINWYEKGADWLLKQQKKDGSWPAEWFSPVSTCLSILFLSRGANPIVMNKLDYSIAVGAASSSNAPASPAGEPQAGNVPPWNQRPRDVANISRWIGRQMERDLNWQIVNLSSPAEELSDAPILYVAGNELLHFTDEQAGKVKQFVENGGVVLATADCASPKFSASFKALGKRMFPAYEFAPLSESHPVYTNQQFKTAKWKRKPTVLSMGNGARELLFLLPEADAGKAWQTGSAAGREEIHQLAANIYLYAIDKQGLRRRGETHLVKAEPKVSPTQAVKIARIQHAGNWDPEPGGWRRLVAVMNNREKVGLVVEAVKPDAPGSLSGYKVAHLTGTGAFELAPAARDAIRQFVESGGTLIVDAAGGNGPFAAAAEKELRVMFPEQAEKLAETLSMDHPLFAGMKVDDTQYRNYARGRIGSLKGPQLRGMEIKGRLSVIFSKEDLSVGLVGHPVDGIVGYAPETATRLMSRAVKFGSGLKSTATTRSTTTTKESIFTP